jgi:hypothetical protein
MDVFNDPDFGVGIGIGFGACIGALVLALILCWCRSRRAALQGPDGIELAMRAGPGARGAAATGAGTSKTPALPGKGVDLILAMDKTPKTWDMVNPISSRSGTPAAPSSARRVPRASKPNGLPLLSQTSPLHASSRRKLKGAKTVGRLTYDASESAEQSPAAPSLRFPASPSGPPPKNPFFHQTDSWKANPTTKGPSPLSSSSHRALWATGTGIRKLTRAPSNVGRVLRPHRELGTDDMS